MVSHFDSNQRFIDIYIPILAKNQNEVEMKRIIKKVDESQRDFHDKINHAKETNQEVYKHVLDGIWYYTDKRTFAEDEYKFKPQHLPRRVIIRINSEPLTLSKDNSVDVVRNMTISIVKKYLQLSNATLTEDLIKAISDRGYQELYSIFEKNDIEDNSGLIIKQGDYEYISNKIGPSKIDLDALIIKKQYNEVIKIATRIGGNPDLFKFSIGVIIGIKRL